MKVLFWGTPLFAVPTLRALEEEGHEVVGVVTQPDRPAGRGRKVRSSPVKEAAEEAGHPVLQPERPRGAEFVERIRSLGPDVSVVVAYGHILPREVLDVPVHGSLNVHASLLPELRGAAPVNWALIRGHDVTGVTVMRMVEEMDAGPILLQVEEPIAETESASDLSATLSELGADALIQALALLGLGESREREQEHARATYAPKIDRETARVDWEEGARRVRDRIRGMDQVPGAWSVLHGEPVKLFRPVALPETDSAVPPGTILEAGEEGIVVAAGQGAVRIEEVQPPGRRRMAAADWVRGRGARQGDRFS